MNLAQFKNCDGSIYDCMMPIRDIQGITVGYLIPIGSWLLKQPQLIERISRWRQTFMRMFLAQFISTAEKTFNYLKLLSIEQPDRILFIIRTLEGHDVGHVGLSNITPNHAELDNLMRGEPGGHVRLVYFAELAVIDWAFKVLKLRRITARVLSYNWMALEMHREVGFQEIARYPLLKIVDGDDINHVHATKPENSNVNYSCLELELNIEDLATTAPWLSTVS